MTDPLVSIIIPVYNAEKYLSQAIESALQQSWDNKEIIIVNDGSTDGSLKIANSYKNAQIKVLSTPNLGASAARNSGLKHARGEYIQFLDADDLLSNDKLKTQISALQSSPNKVAVCSTVHFTDGDLHTKNSPSLYEEAFLVNSENPAWFLVNLWGGYSENGSMIQPNAWLTPRAVIDKAGPWNEELTVDDDGEFFCRILLSSLGVIKTGGYNYYRRYQNNNLSLSARKLEKDYLSLYNSLTLRYNHIVQYDASDALKIAYGKSLVNLKNSIYPLFQPLRKQINTTIKRLEIVLHDNYPLQEKVKKRAINLLGPKVICYLKEHFIITNKHDSGS
jgi:glycosyltransferase involved in cell wall biosynthesis